MLEKLLEFERGLFFLINSSHTPFWDHVMWLYSGIYVWLPFIIFFCFMLIYKRERKEWLYTLGAILVICALCIIFSSLITKPLFARPRPIFHPSFMEEVRTLYESILEPYGFVSGHSATSFGFAMFTSLLFKDKLYGLVIFAWALLMAYSRIYLGVHFISDIIGGGLSGVIIAFLVYQFYRSRIKTEYPASYGKYIAIGLASYITIFTIGSGIWVKFFL